MLHIINKCVSFKRYLMHSRNSFPLSEPNSFAIFMCLRSSLFHKLNSRRQNQKSSSGKAERRANYMEKEETQRNVNGKRKKNFLIMKLHAQNTFAFALNHVEFCTSRFQRFPRFNFSCANEEVFPESFYAKVVRKILHGFIFNYESFENF